MLGKRKVNLHFGLLVRNQNTKPTYIRKDV